VRFRRVVLRPEYARHATTAEFLLEGVTRVSVSGQTLAEVGHREGSFRRHAVVDQHEPN
jgi:hypothetical protein